MRYALARVPAVITLRLFHAPATTLPTQPEVKGTDQKRRRSTAFRWFMLLGAAASICCGGFAATQAVFAAPGPTTTSSTPSAGSVTVGTAVTDTATVTLAAATDAPSTISFYWYPPGTTCTSGSIGAGVPAGTVTFTPGNTSPLTAPSSSETPTTAGPAAFQAFYSGDIATNSPSNSGCEPVTVTLPVATTTKVTSSANPSAVGANVTFTATITPATTGGPPVTGTVTFTISGGPTLTGTVMNGQATATTNALTFGTHTVTAMYSGDTTYISSTSAPLTQSVLYASTTTLASSANPSVWGQPVTITATVAAVPPATGTPTGTVTFTIDGVAGAPVALSGGKASFTTAALAPGTHSITAAYSGDSTFLPSNASLTPAQAVGQATTTLSLTATQVAGYTFQFTATISISPPAAGTPTGTVTFSAGDLPFATVPVSGTVATVTSNLPTGEAVFTGGVVVVAAAYSGDADFLSSVSPSFGLTVLPGQSTSSSTPAPATTTSTTSPTSATSTTASAAYTVTILHGVGTPPAGSIGTGCTAVGVSTPAGTPTSALAARYSGGGLATIWRYDNSSQRLLLAWSAAPGAPLDVTTTLGGAETYWFCGQAGTLTSG
jgi:hypothetical protein